MLSHLACGHCEARHDADVLQTVCRACGGPLLARYRLDALGGLARADFETGPRNLWRFAPLLPVADPRFRLSLGEGVTPLLRAPRLADALGIPGLLVKEEGLNPTGTFKARGMAVAVSRALELGARRFATPTAGNAGVALAAYAARGGAEAHVFVPEDAPRRVIENARALGASVTTVKGLISDAGKACAAFVAANPDVFDVSTLKEPYRAEGKKTMGLELAVDCAWELPDVIVYPTGGGTGIVGMAKAFEEMGRLGLTDEKRPRFVVAQAEGCAPLVRAHEAGKDRAEFFENASTHAAGLRVPKPFADRLVLRAVRDSAGAALAVGEEAIRQGTAALAREGILASPEGGAAVAAARRLAAEGWVRRGERVVVFNTGSSLAY